MLRRTSSPLAVSFTRWLEASVTSNPFALGLPLSRTPCPSKAPPFATVCVPIGVQPFELSGSISREPAASTAFSFLIMMPAISSMTIAWPTLSLPSPAPASTPTKSYRSTTKLAPLVSRWFLNCQPRFAWFSSTPLVRVIEEEPAMLNDAKSSTSAPSI